MWSGSIRIYNFRVKSCAKTEEFFYHETHEIHERRMGSEENENEDEDENDGRRAEF